MEHRHAKWATSKRILKQQKGNESNNNASRGEYKLYKRHEDSLIFPAININFAIQCIIVYNRIISSFCYNAKSQKKRGMKRGLKLINIEVSCLSCRGKLYWPWTGFFFQNVLYIDGRGLLLTCSLSKWNTFWRSNLRYICFHCKRRWKSQQVFKCSEDPKDTSIEWKGDVKL